MTVGVVTVRSVKAVRRLVGDEGAHRLPRVDSSLNSEMRPTGKEVSGNRYDDSVRMRGVEKDLSPCPTDRQATSAQ